MSKKFKLNFLTKSFVISFAAFFAVTAVASAVTTISANLATGGTLSVTDTSTLTGALYANGGLDRSTAAALAIGATNATGVTITPATTITGDLAVNGGDMTSTATTFNLLNATVTTLNVGGAATTVSLGAATGTTTVNNALAITGAVTANGNITFGDTADTDTITFTGYVAGTSNQVVFEGTANGFETFFTVTDATADRTITFPDLTGTVSLITATETLTNKTLTAPTINGGTATALTGLAVRSTGTGAFDLTFANTENLTAGRTLTIKVNDAARTVDIAGNLTLAAAFITSGANSLTLTTTAATNVTLPTTGTLATLAGTETLSGKTLTAPKIADGGFLADANGNELIIFTTTASAVNEITFANAATAASPTVSISGGDANIGLNLQLKGTGQLTISTTTANADTLTFLPAAGGGGTFAGTFTSADLTANRTWTLPDAAGTISLVTGTETLTNKTLTAPKIASGGFLADANGNELIIFTTTASAVNEITFANAATAASPTVSISGGDANIGLNLQLKGTGQLTISTTTANADTLTFLPAAGGGGTFAGTFTSADLTANRTWTLPDAAGTISLVTGTETLTNKTLTAPKIADAGFLADANGNEQIIFTTTASAVNEHTVINAATGNAPVISATGGDTNISLRLTAKGTGVIQTTQPFVEEMSQTALTDTATVTIAQLLTKVLDGTPTAAAVYTLPTAALLVAGIANAQVGDSFYFVVNNKSAGANTITVAAGASGNVDGTLTVAQNVIRQFLVIVTNVTASSEAYFVYGIE